MIVKTQFLKPEEMNVAITVIMPLREAIKLVEGLETVKMNWTADDFKSALKATIDQVRQEFMKITDSPKDSEE